MAAKAFISTFPFGAVNPEPLELLTKHGIEYAANTTGRRLTSEEVAAQIDNADYFIAGTEPITHEVLDAAPNLKLIARVGVGLDNVPFEEVGRRNIAVTFTPTATTRAVAELAVGMILDLARQISLVDRNLRNGIWNKHMGSLLLGKTVGIIGAGRIGREVARLLAPFGVTVLACDVVQDTAYALESGISYVTKEELFARADFVTIHVNYSDACHHLVCREMLALMKPSAFLVNTSRGPVVSEGDLYEALKNGTLAGAALDVFEEEPYRGKLIELPNVVLTPHIGAATTESRYLMELGAVEEVIRFHTGKPLLYPVTKAL